MHTHTHTYIYALMYRTSDYIYTHAHSHVYVYWRFSPRVCVRIYPIYRVNVCEKTDVCICMYVYNYVCALVQYFIMYIHDYIRVLLMWFLWYWIFTNLHNRSYDCKLALYPSNTKWTASLYNANGDALDKATPILLFS